MWRVLRQAAVLWLVDSCNPSECEAALNARHCAASAPGMACRVRVTAAHCLSPAPVRARGVVTVLSRPEAATAHVPRRRPRSAAAAQLAALGGKWARSIGAHAGSAAGSDCARSRSARCSSSIEGWRLGGHRRQPRRAQGAARGGAVPCISPYQVSLVVRSFSTSTGSRYQYQYLASRALPALSSALRSLSPLCLALSSALRSLSLSSALPPLALSLLCLALCLSPPALQLFLSPPALCPSL